MTSELGTLIAAGMVFGFALAGLVILAAIYVRDGLLAVRRRRAASAALRQMARRVGEQRREARYWYAECQHAQQSLRYRERLEAARWLGGEPMPVEHAGGRR